MFAATAFASEDQEPPQIEQVIVRLPPAYRPPNSVLFVAPNETGGVATILIQPDGDVVYNGGSTTGPFSLSRTAISVRS